MKIGFNLLLWTGHVTAEHEALLARVKDAGYDGVEIPLFGGDPGHFADLGRRIANQGLGVTSVGIMPDPSNPTSADAAAREAGAAHLRWLVDCSKALGADVLCGPFHQPLGVFSGRGPTPEELAYLVEAHQAMADYAGPELTLAIEPLNRFECFILNTAEQAAAHVAKVGRPNFGYLYDTFHANIEEKDPVGVIAETAPSIAHVHISENDRGTPGRGHVPLRATLQALKAVGYDRWLTIEAFGQALPDLAAATRVWRKFFADEDEVLVEGIRAIRDGLDAAA